MSFTKHGHIELYDVEDLSKAPQLRARFTLPYNMSLCNLQYPPVFHSASSCAHLATPDNHWIWTINLADRVLCLTAWRYRSAYCYNSSPFFMDIPPSWFGATSEDGLPVPWSSPGPQSSRCFSRKRTTRRVGGSRAVSLASQGIYDD